MTASTEQRLSELKVAARREWQQRQTRRSKPAQQPKPRAWRGLFSELVLSLLKLLFVVSLPFVVLVRAATFFYADEGYPGWLALAAAGLLTLAVLTLYGTWLSRTLTGRARIALVAKWVALPLVLGYCGYALVYLSRLNAKSPAVREAYLSTHPVLRIALSTVILADDGLVITDLRRQPADYARMGLPANERTLHYRQADGWVHAVDLRTEGRGAMTNRMVQLYFWAMGFETLRHTGTGDHLHVQLALTRGP
ncbi:MAG: hypothetical protein ACREL9_04380 [Gemmatimonadales bacterium]